MIKQIHLPTNFEMSSYESQMIHADAPGMKAEAEKKRENFRVWIQEVEAELDQALNDGFGIVAQYVTKDKNVNLVVFVLHKMEAAS